MIVKFIHEHTPGVKNLTVVLQDKSVPVHVNVFRWPDKPVSLGNVAYHHPGNDCDCQFRPEGRCNPYCPTNTELMGLWGQTQRVFGLSGLLLLTQLIVHVLDIPLGQKDLIKLAKEHGQFEDGEVMAE